MLSGNFRCLPGVIHAIYRANTMTRESIEATAKYFIWGLFAFFLFVVFKILQMMGLG